MNIFHRIVSAIADSGVAGQVSRNAWNDAMDIKRSTSADAIVKAGCCAISVGDFEITTGTQLEIEADAVMEIL